MIFVSWFIQLYIDLRFNLILEIDHDISLFLSLSLSLSSLVPFIGFEFKNVDRFR